MKLMKPLACPHCGASLNNFMDATVCPRCNKETTLGASPPAGPPTSPASSASNTMKTDPGQHFFRFFYWWLGIALVLATVLVMKKEPGLVVFLGAAIGGGLLTYCIPYQFCKGKEEASGPETAWIMGGFALAVGLASLIIGLLLLHPWSKVGKPGKIGRGLMLVGVGAVSYGLGLGWGAWRQRKTSIEPDNPAPNESELIPVDTDRTSVSASAGILMNIKLERQLELEATTADVAARLKRWAEAAGFACASDSPPRWTFHRGSQWQAFYTSDIRKIPTDVEITIQAESPLNVRCVWHTHSPLTIATPDDAERLSEQFEDLVAHLRDAPCAADGPPSSQTSDRTMGNGNPGIGHPGHCA